MTAAGTEFGVCAGTFEVGIRIASNSRRSANERAMLTPVKIAPIANASPIRAGSLNHGKTISCVSTATP